MLPVFTADEMHRVDTHAVTALGIPGTTLMENAGRGAAEAIVRFLGPRAAGARVEVVCGKGGNGGDGFVVARWLSRAGARPRVWLAAPEEEIGGDAGAKLAELRAAGLEPQVVGDEAGIVAALVECDLIVDALLGTGARGAPSRLPARLIDLVNVSQRPVVALDIPSGVSADGAVLGWRAVRATLTLTFAGLKRGLLLGPGVDLAGRVEIVPIGVPAEEVTRDATTFLLERGDVARHFPERQRQAHKGTYGHLLVVGGGRGKTGAAALAASAAMRSGVGLATVATASSQQPIVASLVLESMTEPVSETASGTIGLKALDLLLDLAGRREAVALGPGLGLDDETQEVARRLVRLVEHPLVVDADALTAIAGHPDVLRQAPAPRCLTPHPGEMARLLGTDLGDVQRDRLAAAREFARAHRVYLVLKGAMSVLADPEGRVYLNPTGNPGMASGGMGDVLTGMVGAFLARRFEPIAALQAGVFLHGLAADLAAQTTGQESLIASDVIAALPRAFAAIHVPETSPEAASAR
jgi:NAD(P)H-hydrate epimerase